MERIEERKRSLKYIEGYTDKKEASKWFTYWAVIRGTQIFFFKDPDTQIKENFIGTLDLGPQASCTIGKKKKDKFEFELKTDAGRKHLLRVTSDILRQQWLYAIGLSSQLKPPGALPGEEEFNANFPSPTSPLSGSDSSTPPSSSPTYDLSPTMFKFDGLERKLVHRDSSSSLAFDQLVARKEGLEKRRCSVPVVSADKPSLRRSMTSETIALPNHKQLNENGPAWYLGQTRRESAEEILKNQPIGTFLVRDSETVKMPGSYTMDVRHPDKFYHHKIETLPHSGKLVFKDYKDHPFPNLEKLVQFFIRTQEKKCTLIAYDPAGQCPEDKSAQCYEEMDEVQESTDGYMFMENASPPPLPTRKNSAGQPSYENVKVKDKVSPPPPRKPVRQLQSYENVPKKAAAPVPPLPPRQNTGPHSYENIAGKNHNPAPGSYQNMPGREVHPQSYQNVPPRRTAAPQAYQNVSEREAPQNPSHSYQNLLPKATPRRTPTFHAENKPAVPQRPRPPLRRAHTESEMGLAAKHS